jgi:hypothetical protein
MPLIQIILVLILVGVVMYLINLIPIIDATMKKIINGLIIIVVVLWIITIIFPGLWTIGPRLGPR